VHAQRRDAISGGAIAAVGAEEVDWAGCRDGERYISRGVRRGEYSSGICVNRRLAVNLVRSLLEITVSSKRLRQPIVEPAYSDFLRHRELLWATKWPKQITPKQAARTAKKYHRAGPNFFTFPPSFFQKYTTRKKNCKTVHLAQWRTAAG
jgi:hypothetical protein